MTSRREFLTGAASVVVIGGQGQQVSLTFGDALDQLFASGVYSGLMRIGLGGPSGPVSFDDAAQAAAFVGMEGLAARYLANRFSLVGPSSSQLRPDPVREIVRQAFGKRLVILSEWHHAPRHRWFLGEVLEALSREGDVVLAGETFSSMIDGVQTSDPLLRNHGFYLNDPVYGRTVREHLARGGRLASYDTGDASQSNAEREALQTRNLAAILAAMPASGRLVIHAGPGHGVEGPGAMAGRLKAQTGLDPLTVGQRLDERPMTSRNRTGLWSTAEASGYDLMVHHFLETPEAFRSAWVERGRSTQLIVGPRQNNPDCTLIVRAVAARSPPAAIPLDVAVMNVGGRRPRLICSRSDRIVFEG